MPFFTRRWSSCHPTGFLRSLSRGTKYAKHVGASRLSVRLSVSAPRAVQTPHVRLSFAKLMPRGTSPQAPWDLRRGSFEAHRPISGVVHIGAQPLSGFEPFIERNSPFKSYLSGSPGHRPNDIHEDSLDATRRNQHCVNGTDHPLGIIEPFSEQGEYPSPDVTRWHAQLGVFNAQPRYVSFVPSPLSPTATPR